MGLLAGLYALFGIGGTAYVAGSGIMSPGNADVCDPETAGQGAHPVQGTDRLIVVLEIERVILFDGLQLLIVPADDLHLPFEWLFTLDELVIVDLWFAKIFERPV